jgi:error-prone DNA polymerase
MYVPLRTKSHYSFLEGASSPEELVDRAVELGLPALGLADRDGVYGLVRAHVRAKERGLRLVPGAEITVHLGADEASSNERNHAARRGLIATRDHVHDHVHDHAHDHAHDRDRDRRSWTLRRGSTTPTPRAAKLTLYPESERGYARMCRLLSRAQARGPKGVAWTTLDEVREHAGELFVIGDDAPLLGALREAYGRSRLFGFVERHLEPGDREREALFRAELRALGLRAVGGVEVLYHERSRRPLQDVVTCIRSGKTLATAGRLLRPNAEHDLLAPSAMAARFADAPELLVATRELAERCTFDLGAIRYRYPEEQLPAGHTEHGWLRELTYRGAARRYPRGIPSDVRAQLERELSIIGDLDYGGYFLTMHEIVERCGSEGILCQGRGSAANSAVCFCLGITAVDPVRMDLLFERFLSRERAEPPDIDLDIEHERREEVIQHVYRRYGRRHAAMVANVIRYRSKSAVREVGKALGMPMTDLDAVARLLSPWGGNDFDPQLARDGGLDPKAPATAHLLRLASALEDTPRHLSIHPGGFLLGHRPVDELVPIEPATMENRTVIQWDKYDVEALGLFKVDLLGLGALTCIQKSFELLREHEGIDVDMATVPQEDPATYAMCTAGDTVGVFQIESRAQMAMLPRLRPRTFYDLVIEVAIVRPGPIQGNMVHPYLRRRHGDEEVTYPHPKLERVLAKTLGVPIFQEQVMKVAVEVADYTPGEADQLRRDMAAWKSSGKIERHHERMVKAMIANGIDEAFAERVFSQIRGFGEYGFPESHAASFALLAYVTAWLRRHHPAVFACGLLNSQPMGFYSTASIVEDAKRHGVATLPVDVRTSGWDCTLWSDTSKATLLEVSDTKSIAETETETETETFVMETGTTSLATTKVDLALRMGFRTVKGLPELEARALLAARAERPFADLDDVVRRSGVNERGLVALAEAGAFESFGIGRRDALWRVKGAAKSRHDALPATAPSTQLSFAALAPDEAVLWDYRASRHSTRGHPLARFREALRARGMPDARELSTMRDGTRTDFVGLVICRQRPQTASGVTFLTLEDETGFANLVVWRTVDEAHHVLLRTSVVLGVTGKVQSTDGVVHLVADALWALPTELAHAARDIEHRSRDFH